MPLHIVRGKVTCMEADAIVTLGSMWKTLPEGIRQKVEQDAWAKRPGWLFGWHQDVICIRVVGQLYERVIHLGGVPQEQKRYTQVDVRRFCREAMRRAEKEGCESVAIPLILREQVTFPHEEALRIATQAIQEYLQDSDLLVYLVLPDEDDLPMSGVLLDDVQRYLAMHYRPAGDAEDGAGLAAIAYAEVPRRAYMETRRREREESVRLAAEESASYLDAEGLRRRQEEVARLMAEAETVAAAQRDGAAVRLAAMEERRRELDKIRRQMMEKEAALEEDARRREVHYARITAELDALEKELRELEEAYSCYMQEAQRFTDANAPLTRQYRLRREKTEAEAAPPPPSDVPERPRLDSAPAAQESRTDAESVQNACRRSSAQPVPSPAAMPAARRDRRPQDSAAPKDADGVPPGLSQSIREMDVGFTMLLLRLIDEKKMTDAECYRRANIDRRLFSKIRSDLDYRPKKTTAVAFCVALRLNMEETQMLLARAGYALSPARVFDVVVSYFIEHQQYNVFDINVALLYYDQPLLGSMDRDA